MVNACSGPGPVDREVKFWRRRLDFKVPREKAIQYLKEYGAWSKEELDAQDDEKISEKVLWLACNDIKEEGRWYGLNH